MFEARQHQHLYYSSTPLGKRTVSGDGGSLTRNATATSTGGAGKEQQQQQQQQQQQKDKEAEKPASSSVAAADKPPPAAQQDEFDGFSTAIGNGLFWLLPYVMYWASSTSLHSGLFDNGRLDADHARCGCSFRVLAGLGFSKLGLLHPACTATCSATLNPKP